VIVLVVFLVLMLVVTAFWLVPLAVKIPARVPQQWVDEYGTPHR
jgi:hypothetical protein